MLTVFEHLKASALGRLVREHVSTLPRFERTVVTGKGRVVKASWWPSWLLFVIGPAGTAVALAMARGLEQQASIVNAMLAAVGVLTGLLVQVLAWIGGRIGALADEGKPATASGRRRLLDRLSMARANVAYASLVSLLLTLLLALQATVKGSPGWLSVIDLVLLLHLAPTLVLVLTRINEVGVLDDRSARRTSDRAA